MPASAHHFIPVWQSLEAEKTHRSKEYGPSRKRKRQLAQDDSDDEDAYSQPSRQAYAGTRDYPKRVTSGTNGDPYRVAGHAKGLPLPDHPFPHAPVKEPRRDATVDKSQKDLATLKPPLYVPPIPEEEDARTSLRRHHLGVMNTIMHTSLLRGDYVRAGRAWGMILRTEVLGRAIDVRTHERWGVGAEILLRQHAERAADSSPDAGDYHVDDRTNANEITFSEEGFNLARAYYERLILQYPYQKTHPNAISSLTFYPAMYGLWIYQIQQKYSEALKQAEATSRSPSPDYAGHVEDHDDDGEGAHRGLERRITNVKKSTLDEAIALSDRMNEIFLSPPYNSHPPLTELRAMLALWIVDLIHDIANSDDEVESTYKARVEREMGVTKKFFDDAKRTGRELPEFFSLGD